MLSSFKSKIGNVFCPIHLWGFSNGVPHERADNADAPHWDSSPESFAHDPRPQRLENTLKPNVNLSRDMSITETDNWLKGFTAWFDWNAPILDSKGPLTKRVLLENFLDERLLSKLKTDVTVTMDTPVLENEGLIDKLRSYKDGDCPIICRHAFTACKQEHGEPFLTWWERKMKKHKKAWSQRWRPITG